MNRWKRLSQQSWIFFLNFIKAAWDIIKTIGKSLLWFVLTFIFGLLQAWVVFGQSYMLEDMSVWNEVKNQIMGGALLFFSTAITASLTIDYFMLKDVNFSKTETGFLFVFSPAIILASAILVFSAIYLKPTEAHFQTVMNLELVILSITFIYAIIVKTMLEYRLKKQFELELKKRLELELRKQKEVL